MSSNSENCREATLLLLKPYAERAARSARFRWGLDEDDVFQQIMLDAWIGIESAINADNPVKWMRRGVRFSVGHAVESRYWRRGNGVTDQMEDDYDAADKTIPDIDADIDMRSAMAKVTQDQRMMLNLTLQMGYKVSESAKIMGIPKSTMHARVKDACEEIAVALGTMKERRTKPLRMTFIACLRHEDGRVVRGNESSVLIETGLSRGSYSNLKTGKRDKVNGWRLV